MPAGIQQYAQQAQISGFADAPRGQPLAANAVDVHARSFEYQDGKTISRQTGGESSTRDTGTGDHNIKVVASGHLGSPVDLVEMHAGRRPSRRIRVLSGKLRYPNGRHN